MAIEPVEIKDTLLKNFSLTLDFAAQEDAGGVQSAGHTTGAQIVDYIGNLNLSNLTDVSEARKNITSVFPQNIYYVSQFGGDDINGNGSILSPWATLSHALNTLPSSATDFYTVKFSGIITDTAQIQLKPNINIDGFTQGSLLINSLPITLHSSFNTILNQGPFIQNCQINGELNFDASFVTSSSSPFIQMNGVNIYGPFTCKGSATNNVAPQLYTYNCFFSSMILINVTHNSFLDWNVSANINDTLGYYHSTKFDNLTIGSAYLNTNMNLNINSARIGSISISAPNSLTFTPNFLLTNSVVLGPTKTIDGGKAILKTDVSTYVDYTLTNGATVQLLSQVITSINALTAQDQFISVGANLDIVSDVDTHTINLTDGVTQQGNFFNGADELLMLDSLGKIPVSLLPSVGVNQVIFGDGSGQLSWSPNLTYDSGTGIFTANSAVFSNTSGLTINGNAPSARMGAGTDIGEATTNGQFATNSLAADGVLRAASGKTLRLLAGSGTSVLDIDGSLANLNFPITLAQTQDESPVTGSVKSNFEYFEDQLDTQAFTTATTGALVFANYKIRCRRIGSKVELYPDVFSQNAVAATTINLTTVLPAKFRPPVNMEFHVAGQRGGVKLDIAITVSSAGNVVIFGGVNGANFNNGQVAAYFGQPIGFYVI